jgi:hypothetical protein
VRVHGGGTGLAGCAGRAAGGRVGLGSRRVRSASERSVCGYRGQIVEREFRVGIVIRKTRSENTVQLGGRMRVIAAIEQTPGLVTTGSVK